MKYVLTVIFGILMVFMIGSLFLTGGWMIYTDGPYKGKVIELETGKPIEGAMVAGVWDVSTYLGPGGPSSSFCNAKEALTDKNGEFKVPRMFCWHWWPLSTLEYPTITIFKPGYLGYPPLGATQEERNLKMPGFNGKEFRTSDTIPVIKLGRPKTQDERIQTLYSAEAPLILDIRDFKLINKKTKKLLELTTIETTNLGLLPRR